MGVNMRGRCYIPYMGFCFLPLFRKKLDCAKAGHFFLWIIYKPLPPKKPMNTLIFGS